MIRKLLLLILGVLLILPAPMLQADSFAPTASFFVTPSTGAMGTTFTVNASASTDQRGFNSGLEYRWNFDYTGSGDFGAWTNQDTATFTPSDTGDLTISLEVRDGDGNTDRTFQTVSISSGDAFSAWFTASPDDGDVDTEFRFEAEIAAPGGSQFTEDYEVRWDFDADGAWDTPFSTTRVEYHTFGEAGLFNPRMEVRSPSGQTVLVIGQDDGDDDNIDFIHVTFGETPNASLSASPTAGTSATIIYFDATSSSDRQDSRSELEYRWDFDGNGTFEIGWGSTTTTNHQYEVPGTYEATVQVRDTDGNTDEAFLQINIRANDVAPEAEFSVTSDSRLPDRTLGTTNTTFTFNASRSEDEEDSLGQLQARWDFDGDGDWDTSYSTTKSAQHRFLDPGSYTVRLEIRDTDGLRDIATETITIVANDAPLPALEVEPLSGTPGTLFNFDATDSTDSQYTTSQLEVRWDWEGDGQWDTGFERDKTVSHQYDRAGIYDATMQVRDPEGQYSTISQTISVSNSTHPQARLAVDLTEGTYSTLFHFDASASRDGETHEDDLLFRWDFDYTGTNDIQYDSSWGRSRTRTQRFRQGTGEITVRVEVKDEDDEISTAYLSVNLHWASPYMDTLKSRGIIRGYSNLGNSLEPNRLVSRAELLKMAMEAADISLFGHQFQGYYSDVIRTDWFDQYVEVARDQDIVAGYSDGSFRPNNSINRAEATKIILAAFEINPEPYRPGSFPDVHPDSWFAPYVGTAHHFGLISGHQDGYFRPEGLMTRGEASKVIALALQNAL